MKQVINKTLLVNYFGEEGYEEIGYGELGIIFQDSQAEDLKEFCEFSEIGTFFKEEYGDVFYKLMYGDDAVCFFIDGEDNICVL